MDEKGANIDLVFRNGLKDFEVLPPPEVWENIHPVIKTRQKPYVLISAAALITVVLSLSFLAYRLSLELPAGIDNNIIAFNIVTPSPDTSPSLANPLTTSDIKNVAIKNSLEIFSDNAPVTDLESEIVKTNSPIYAEFPETRSIPVKMAKSLIGRTSSSFNSSKNTTFEIMQSDLQYFPLSSSVKETDRWSVAAMASPTYYSKFNSGNDELSREMMASEQAPVSYSGGVAFSYKINKRFSIQSGLYYASLGQVVSGINSYGGFNKFNYTKGADNFQVLTTSGLIHTKNSDIFLIANNQGDRVLTSYTIDVLDPKKASLPFYNSTMRQDFSYLELPVVLRYKFVDKTIDLNLIGGVSYNMLVNNSVYTMVDGSKYPIGETDGLNLLSVSSSLGMGMEYNFSENLSLNLEPTFRYYLNPFNNLTSSKIHPYSFGIFSGVSYKF